MQAPSPARRPPWPPWCAALVLAAVVVLVWLPAARLPFISLDDPDYVSDNPHVAAGLTWPGVEWAFTTVHASNWHPLTWLSHLLDATLFGPGPLGPHSVNLALHAANAALLLLLLQRLTGAFWRSALVAALFALHPLRVESVAWVSERKDVLCAFFFLLTLHSYFNYTTATRHRVVWYATALALFALGLLSKPMLVTLPCVLLLLDVWPLERVPRGFKSLVVEKIPFFLLSAASCFATYHAQQLGGAVRTLEGLPLGARLANAIFSVARYVGLSFHPDDLAIYYPHSGNTPAFFVLLVAALLAAGAVQSFRRVRSEPHAFVGFFWFLGMLVPVIGLVQVGSQSMADRYTYLPSIGFFIALVWGLAARVENIRWQKSAAIVVVLAALTVSAVLTRAQLGRWRDSETLFRHTLAVTRNNFVAHYNLGSTLLTLGRADEAIEQFEKTLALHPRYAEAHVDLGNALLQKARPLDAVARYQQALALAPNLANAHYNLGTTLLQLGRLDEALPALERAAALQPQAPKIPLNLGILHLQKNDLPRAIENFERATVLQPDLADAHSNLGFALAQSGQPDRANAHLQTALKISPRHANAHFHLGNLLLQQGRPAEAAGHLEQTLAALPGDLDTLHALAAARFQQGDLPAAIVHLETALKLQPANARLHANLALALQQAGRHAEAAEAARRAVDLANAAGDVTLAEALRQQFSPK